MMTNVFAEGLSTRRRPMPFTLVVYGATGDLASRKLFPALYTLYREGALDDWRMIGFARREWNDDTFRSEISKSLDRSGFDSTARDAFLSRCSYIRSEFDDPKGYASLAESISDQRELIHYLATTPDNYRKIVERLGAAGLARLRSAATRVVVEKPFGRDGNEAQKLNRYIAERFDEESIFRIDHYLGKETVQNIAVFRFGNSIFEPVWNNAHIEFVEITVAEAVGVETRAAYFEKSGALRDMVQNHILQLLALVAMEPPSSLTADAIRDEKVKVFRSLRSLDSAAIARDTVRAQYGAGIVEGNSVPAYRDEKGVSPGSVAETYAALKIHLDSWRWAGVPFIIRTGKRLSRRLSEITVHFKAPPIDLFPRGWTGGNKLVFRIQPDEGLTLYLDTKIPGLQDKSRSVSMDFLYGTGFGIPSPEAYERLLLDALIGDGTLYTRRDEVESSWAFIDPIRKAWDENVSPLRSYEAGLSGPSESVQLPLSFGKTWRRL
ncbi:MAG TPA: glucose-6-phosphate dehydrogenase [Treponema sp.]|nr:MAG: glucose-6-phosphate dehydrogenase [Treponema sp. GWC1_61_84]OHE74190.1 MAG: glucose-6-phosphate dehydrogenase [Treponema sp. RIFOXYC1_FULL_61_9]HCM25679.1 glucose-6-phosphate dehydrogenase [Treponema sp.]